MLREDSPLSSLEEGANATNASSSPLRGPDLLAHYDAERYGGLLFTVGFLLLSSALVAAFKETPLIVRLERRALTESLLLIVVGIGFGAVTRAADFRAEELRDLQARNLLDFLVPPIVLSCAYNFYQRDLVVCSDGVFLQGIVGTAFSIFAIGCGKNVV